MHIMVYMAYHKILSCDIHLGYSHKMSIYEIWITEDLLLEPIIATHNLFAKCLMEKSYSKGIAVEIFGVELLTCVIRRD